MELEKTFKGESFFKGIALHTGARAAIRFSPAPAGTGVIFRRVDLPGKPSLRAFARNVVDVRRGTTIAEGAAKVYTVEHVLAALHAFGIDNAIVEMDGPEPPIGDGSGKPYVDMIEKAGIVELEKGVEFWVVDEPAEIAEGNSRIRIEPYDGLKISCSIAFGASSLDVQKLSVCITPETYAKEIAPARTFCLYKELEQLIKMGLVKGGSLDNAVVIHDGAIICKEELRYQDELVRHKILDIVGDLYLLGRRVKGHVIAEKPGHPTNVLLCKKLLEEKMRVKI